MTTVIASPQALKLELRASMEILGYTVERLAAKMGVTPRSVNRWISLSPTYEKYCPSQDVVDQLRGEVKAATRAADQAIITIEDSLDTDGNYVPVIGWVDTDNRSESAILNASARQVIAYLQANDLSFSFQKVTDADRARVLVK